MKRSNLLFSILLAFAVSFTMSCKDEEPVVPPSEGIPVADGFYLAKSGEDPVATAQLKPAKVDAPSFSAMTREGFVQAYVYLTAGSYNLVEVTDKEIVNTYGGTMSTVNGEPDVRNMECDPNDSKFNVVEVVADGAAFSIAEDGFYVVGYDATLSEVIFDQLTSVGIIGDATDGGWSTDTPLTGTVTADGGSWEVTDVVLKPGVFKFRFNCRWAIDRRLDPTQDFDNANGYSMFTNFGNTIDQLLPGNEGGNIEVTERAKFTITFTWDPVAGASGTITRTGDAPPLTFDPADWNWGVIGNGVAKNWDADMNMYYAGESGGTYTWYTVVVFEADSLYKFRTNDSWDTNLGGSIDNLSFGGPDMDTPGAGDYFITLQTADDGVTWTASMTPNGWGIIGTGSPQGNWDADIDMTAAIENGVETFTITGAFTTDGWKFRANDDWAYNLGGDAAGLTVGGNDIMLSSAGNYTVVLTYDGTTYTYTVN